MDNTQPSSDNPIEVWSRKMGFNSSPQTSLFFQKIWSHPKMNLYMKKIMKHVKPKNEADMYHKRYLYCILKNGSFSPTNQLKFAIETERDVKLYKKYLNFSSKIYIYKEIKMKESLNDLKELKCKFEKSQNSCKSLVSDIRSFRECDLKLSALINNLNQFKNNFVLTKKAIKHTILKQAISDNCQHFLTSHIKSYECEINNYLHINLNTMLKKSPQSMLSILIEAINNLIVDFEFKTHEPFDFKKLLGLFLTEYKNSSDMIGLENDFSSDNYQAAISDKIDNIKTLYEEQNNFVKAINDNNGDPKQFYLYLLKLKEDINKNICIINSSHEIVIDNIKSLTSKISENLENINRDLSYSHSSKDSINKTHGTIDKFNSDANEILNQWNTSVKDKCAYDIIKNKVNLHRFYTSLVESRCILPLKKYVAAESDPALKDSTQKLNELIEIYNTFKKASERCNEVRNQILKDNKSIELIAIDNVPINEVRAKLHDICFEMEVLILFFS